MKITLYLDNKIIEFNLPMEVSGSFSFDENRNEEEKLINIEAREGSWFLYSTEDSKIKKDVNYIEEEKLQENTFYQIERKNKVYLIYVTSSRDETIIPYKYDNNINILFGNDNSCNIIYTCSFINGPIFTINSQENSIVLTKKSNIPIYLNQVLLTQENYKINVGDQIHIYGLNMFILNGIILINNPNNNVIVNEQLSNLKHSIIPIDKDYSTEEIKDVELYQESEYFSKSPRLRRFIETKKIKLDPPPSNNNNEEMPLMLVIAPMLTMGITSLVTITNVILRLNSRQTTMSQSWPQLVTASTMLLSSLLWPIITNLYNKKNKERKRRELIAKYSKYLKEKENELQQELKLQHDILIENLITLNECINQIQTRGVLFWNKRSDQNDFLNVRIGTGNEKLDIEVEYPEQGFTVDEDELRKQTDAMVEKYKYIPNVPIGYSIYENVITAVMGDYKKCVDFVNNLLVQLLTFYTYEDIKLVFLTSEENAQNWEYAKYLNHCFSNSKDIRFFATEENSIKNVAEYISFEVNNRKEQEVEEVPKPYYIIITDNYEEVKRYDFIQDISESENNLGFSVLLIENKLSKLPSKCSNFISLSGNKFAILKNSYEKQEVINFSDEINPSINMNSLSKILSNIPIEFEEGIAQLPDAVTFLEMEQVGKVEQLNILNRWNTNDSTISLKAEIGIGELGNIMYLDLHEKYHGPHGLIAGMTGSGKSEFIITYILSMAINYSPEYVSFILIDYKGGGLAFAFENQATGKSLPHLAGTITNLDKAEMDRTLVSINSELERRQKLFNEARDKLGESTIDIYKYQKFYQEGKIEEPITHLFIICDEFAELKSQQPDFMDNLISVARIGRSLGVHLILATQKPSGVVNDQIWSNTKFRVCLKVQDASDSKEMIKRPDAASLKQAGRYYLQVGYDEYFALGQSGWCGAKYYPSNKVVKIVDKSINFIEDSGQIIKSVQASNDNIKKEAQGEQLTAILDDIIKVSKKTNKKCKRLWLDNIPAIILIENLIEKYEVQTTPYNVEAIIGEYDAPEKQEQGLVKYNMLEDGNTIIYGLDSSEREMLLETILYSTMTRYTPEEINYYIIDYGSESTRKYSKFPHIGGMVFSGEDEKLNNLRKMITSEIDERKKLFSEYNGEYSNYIKNSGKTMPLKVLILNNYDSINENVKDLLDWFPNMVRDSARYGIIFILTANTQGSVFSKVAQNFDNLYALKLNQPTDYSSLFTSRKKITPRDIIGRGILKREDIYEFQVASIKEDDKEKVEIIEEAYEKIKDNKKATAIPTLPEKVTVDTIKTKLKDSFSIPIGISKNELDIITLDLSETVGTVISSNKINYTNNFVKSLMYELQLFKDTNILFIDGNKKIPEVSKIIKNYYNDNLDKTIEMLLEYYSNNNEKSILVIYAVERLISKLENKNKFDELINLIKSKEKNKVIIVEDAVKLKTFVIEDWYKKFSSNEGIWIGKGIVDQSAIKVNTINRELTQQIPNKFGFRIIEGIPTLIKLIDFYKEESEDND